MGSGAARRWRAEAVGGSCARERAELLRATLSRRRSWGAAEAGRCQGGALGASCAHAHVAHEDAVDVVRVCLGATRGCNTSSALGAAARDPPGLQCGGHVAMALPWSAEGRLGGRADASN